MSIRIMSQVWENGPNNSTEVLVLLAIADFCNDAGECWPSVASIAEKARMSERGVQKVIQRLSDAGWLEVSERTGRRGCNCYLIKTPNVVHPEPGSPPNRVRVTPEPGSPQPPNRVHPNLHLTINEPSDMGRATVESVLDGLASAETIASFIAYRRKSKAKALTVTAAKRLAQHLNAISAKGGNPDDALGMAEERGWLTVEPDWYFRNRPQATSPGPDNRIAKWKKLAGART